VPYCQILLSDTATYKYIVKSDIIRKNIKWKPAITMPAKFSRYFIEIVGVKCERVQQISNQDEYAEGINVDIAKLIGTASYHEGIVGYCYNSRDTYAALFDKINGKGAWEKNPYVWAYQFRLVNKSFDEILELNKDVLIRLKDK